MPASDAGAERASLLAVFAHPDDESLASGGLLARCAEHGVDVALLCLTHGEHGRGREHAALGDVRARELRDAAAILGVRDVVVLDHEDGMLPWLEHARLEADIGDAIGRFKPHVVVTFDEDGLYWHPDHIAVHERTTAAVAALGPSGPALFYVSIPAGSMRCLVDAASRRARDGDGAPPHVLGVTEPEAFGSSAPTPTLVVDAAAFAVRKLSALRCHRTQCEGSALELIGERDAQRFLGTEHYRRARIGSRDPVFLEQWGTTMIARSGT